MKSILTLPALFYLCLAVYSVSMTIKALRKLRVYKMADYLLVILHGLFFLITLGLFGTELSWWSFLDQGIRFHLPWYGMLLFSGFLYALTYAVFKNESPSWAWLIVSILIIITAVAADGNCIFPGDLSLGNPGDGYAHSILSVVIQALGWGIFVILSSILVLQEYRETERMVVKQRAIYWTAALILFTGSSILFLISHYLLGCLLLLLATLVINFLVLTYRLPDLKFLTFQAASFLLSGIVIILLYALGFLILERYFLELPWYKPVFNGAFFFLIALIFFFPVQNVVRTILQKFLVKEKNPTQEIRSYSKTLSSILDIELLSKVTIELICDSLEVNKGTLFLVDQVDSEKDSPNWCLRAVQGTTITVPDLEFLPANSPISKVLAEEKRPLTQSELEFIPKFQTIPENILMWIKALEVEALVPIHTEDEWIGLFALSQKRSGASFTDEEIELLSTLADQTSVALQNARLVESLTKIDNQLRRAKASKNTALDKIERIKKSASDIISIKAHELRSPLTIVSGYTQLLANDSALMEDSYYSELIQGIISGSDRLQSIIENMISTASIQPSSLNIGTQPISLYTIVDTICRDLQSKVQARKLTLSHDNLSEIPAVYGDIEALTMVFKILIHYAMTHTPSGGKIKITGRHIPPRSDILKWEGAEIIVCDTGIGIDSEAQDRFFQEHTHPYLADFSILDEIAEGEERPGEQLAIARSIIEAHNGRVWVERMEKDAEHLPGSEFHVVLPLEQQSNPTQPE